jgi:hypothetical protein
VDGLDGKGRGLGHGGHGQGEDASHDGQMWWLWWWVKKRANGLPATQTKKENDDETPLR